MLRVVHIDLAHIEKIVGDGPTKEMFLDTGNSMVVHFLVDWFRLGRLQVLFDEIF